VSRLQSNAGTTFSTVVQSALCLRNQPVWHTILDKEALKKDNLGLSLVTGAETWASTEPDGHSGAGQLPGAWVSVASETEKTFAYFLALLNYSKRAHKSRAKRALKNERKDALGGQKPTGPKRSVQPLVVTIKLHSNCFRPSSSLALSLSGTLCARDWLCACKYATRFLFKCHSIFKSNPDTRPRVSATARFCFPAFLSVVLGAFNFHLVYFNVIFNSSVFSRALFARPLPRSHFPRRPLPLPGPIVPSRSLSLSLVCVLFVLPVSLVAPLLSPRASFAAREVALIRTFKPY